MQIYFVRHGHPDYANDCLTELGHKQAEAAAKRLMGCGIERIFSSTNGRAVQTAEHTARALGLDVTSFDFMREISWGSVDGEPILAKGHPWLLADLFASEGRSLTYTDWREKEPFCKSRVVECERTVIEGLDGWLEELGYKREGEYYRVMGEDEYGTVAMFSHGGSSTVALSHLFNLPFPLACGALHLGFTSITVVKLCGRVGELIYPKLVIANDDRHIYGIEVDNEFGN